MSELVQIEQPTVEQQPKRNLNLCFSNDIRDHFPFGEVRPAQEIGLAAIDRAYAEDKKFIVIEAPTGSGKSGMAIAAASYAKVVGARTGAYILSPQITLTEQYMSDFGSNGKVTTGLLELKGKSNFTCTTYVDEFGNPVSCEEGSLLCSSEAKKAAMMDDEESEGPVSCTNCPYKAAKKAFVDNPLGVTNFAYYLGETSHAGQLTNREMLILDEGHNTENMILGFTDLEINKKRMQDVGLNGQIPVIKPGETQKALDWLLSTFRPAVLATIIDLEDQMATARNKSWSVEARGKLAKKLNGMKQFNTRLDRFINAEDKGEWLVWTDQSKGTPSFGNLIIRPLTATLFADEILFNKANKVLILSATILDFGTFLRNLGISREDAVCVRIDCDFPVENRWIDYMPVGNMSSTLVKCPKCEGRGCSFCWQGKVKSIDLVLPKMGPAVDYIMRTWHPNDKGFVPTNSYKVTNELINGLSPEMRERVVTHTSEKGARNRAQIDHINADFPSVLFSPSMSEGLDLKDDLSRFSIMSKVPYPFMDPYVKARSERDRDWYAWQTALTMVQSTGRSNRHKGDVAHHYILDEAFRFFVTKNEKMFPKWWLAAVRFHQDRDNHAPWETSK